MKSKNLSGSEDNQGRKRDPDMKKLADKIGPVNDDRKKIEKVKTSKTDRHSQDKNEKRND